MLKDCAKAAPQTLPRSVPKMRLKLALTSRNPKSALWDALKSAFQSRLEPAFQSRPNSHPGLVLGNENGTGNGTQKLALTSRNPCQAVRFRAPKTAAKGETFWFRPSAQEGFVTRSRRCGKRFCVFIGKRDRHMKGKKPSGSDRHMMKCLTKIKKIFLKKKQGLVGTLPYIYIYIYYYYIYIHTYT